MKKVLYSLAAAMLALSWSCTSSDADAAAPAPEASAANLQAVMAQIDNYLVENEQTPALDNIASVSLDEMAGRVVVGLERCDDAAVADFRAAVCNSPLLSFEQSARMTMSEPRTINADRQAMRIAEGVEPGDLVTLRSGRDLWRRIPFYNDFEYIGCLAYRAKRSFDGVVGFVCPGTKLTMGETVYTVDGGVFKPVGAVIALQKDQEVDAAFCSLTANVTSLTNVVPSRQTGIYSEKLPAKALNPQVNSSVFMYGEEIVNATGFGTSGRVQALNATVVVDRFNTLYKGMIKLVYDARLNSGDLGGLVTTQWDPMSSVPATSYVMGMHISGDLLTGYAIPVAKINKALELSLYK